MKITNLYKVIKNSGLFKQYFSGVVRNLDITKCNTDLDHVVDNINNSTLKSYIKI